MKRILVFTISMLLLSGAIYSQKSVDRFITKKMKEKVGYAVSLPKWLFKNTSKWTTKFDNEEDVEKYWKLTKYVKNFRGYMYEGKLPNQSEVKQMLQDLKTKDNFEEYVTVRHDGSNVNVFVNESGDMIKGFVFLVNTDDTFAIARIKTKLPYEVFKELNYKIL